MEKGKLIVVSAPSGSGKTTLVQSLLKQNLPLSFSISATSRLPRGKEQNGIDYHFLSLDDFKKKIEANAFVEYEEVYPGKFYGTLRSELEKKWSEGQNIIFDVDVIGGLNIKSEYPQQTLAIFIQAPSLEVLEKRLRSRGTESEVLLEERLAKAQMEMEQASKFDFLLVNDDLEVSKKQLLARVKDFIG
ncbi:MAG: guanylate kinase [Flavobacteriaceae bacterium]